MVTYPFTRVPSFLDPASTRHKATIPAATFYSNFVTEFIGFSPGGKQLRTQRNVIVGGKFAGGFLSYIEGDRTGQGHWDGSQ
jgi:hypothetical protein